MYELKCPIWDVYDLQGTTVRYQSRCHHAHILHMPDILQECLVIMFWLFNHCRTHLYNQGTLTMLKNSGALVVWTVNYSVDVHVSEEPLMILGIVHSFNFLTILIHIHIEWRGFNDI